MMNVLDEINQRIGLGFILSLARKKMVPQHRHTIWYYMGGMLLFLLLIQLVTGPLLLFFYKPSADAAYQSVKEIMVNVPYGWLIRSVHHWSSNIMIVVVFVHFFSTLIVKAYRKPREITWLTGMLMLLLVLFLGYSGYVLPFDERAFFALNVGTEIPGAIPVVGEYAMEFLRGGATVGAHTLNRFFAMHVGILPLALLIVIGVHVLLVQLHGMSVPVSVEKEMEKKKKKVPYKPMFPHLLWHDVVNCLILLGVVVTLAVLMPSGLDPDIDFLKPAPDGVKPDWFFLWVYQILKWIPTYVMGIEGEVFGIVVLSMAAGFIAFVPFVDWKSQKNELSPIFTLIGVISLIVFVVCTVIGYL